MDFEDLAAQLFNQTSLPATQWPAKIYPPEGKVPAGLFGSTNQFWREIKALRKHTDSGKDGFKHQYEGSTGWEYELIMALVHHKLFYSEIHTSRDYEQVSNSHTLEIAANVNQETKVLTDVVKIDGKERGELTWDGLGKIAEREELIKSGKYKAGFVCHFHSHPVVKVTDSKGELKDAFTFFSRQDMQTFFGGKMAMMGLVTDRVWLICKTPASVMPEHRELHAVTRMEVEEPWRLATAAYETLSRHDIVLYHADFDGSFMKVDEQLAVTLAAQDEQRLGSKIRGEKSKD